MWVLLWKLSPYGRIQSVSVRSQDEGLREREKLLRSKNPVWSALVRDNRQTQGVIR